MSSKMPDRHTGYEAVDNPSGGAVGDENCLLDGHAHLVLLHGVKPVCRSDIEVYNTRYWILLSFSLLGMCQTMNCFTLTSLPSSSERYFGVTQAQLIMIFNWQCVGTHSGSSHCRP